VAFTTCPISEVHAPIERVWAYLAQPSNYALWWDAVTTAIIPEGPVRPGQKILGRTRALAREWSVTVLVRHVDEAHHALQLTTTLPCHHRFEIAHNRRLKLPTRSLTWAG